jgi:hypothetical protein
MEKLIITPKTKIFDLIETFPELEDVLISMAPEFRKLKNPVLRKTIGKITTVAQASVIGNLKVEYVVNKLREVVGQDKTEVTDGLETVLVKKRPEWFSKEGIVYSIDAKRMLDAGEHPVNEVLATIGKMNAGEITEVIVPFLPVPLIEKATGLGFSHWINKKSPSEFLIYFTLSEKR